MTEIQPGSCEWQDLVQYVRDLDARSCWEVGDIALKIAPEVVGHGGDRKSSDHSRLNFDHLRQFAADSDIGYARLYRYRTVSQAWPTDKRISSCSHRVHLMLAPYEDRYDLIRPGMKVEDAEKIQAERRHGQHQIEPTALNVLNEVIAARQRLHDAFRAAQNSGLRDNEQVLGELAALETEAEQFRQYLTGMGLDEAIEKIMEAEDA